MSVDDIAIAPHPYACQVEGCKGRIGQAILDLGAKGSLRVCLYHYVLCESAALPQLEEPTEGAEK